MKYTLKTIEQTHVLMINGKPSECPFKTGLAGVNNLGTPQFINQQCNSQCAQFNLSKQSPGTLILNCSSFYNEIKLTDEPETETKPTLTIIKP
jgi:hypothetical protein